VGTKRARGADDNTQHEHKGKKGDRKAMVKLEESRSGQPSRKSSRGSSNRQRSDAMLEYVSRMKSATPQARYSQSRRRR
jgi:hypothetical protein